MSVSRTALLGSLAIVCGATPAADEDVPEAAFLEYLGSWDGSDEDWLIFSDHTDTEKDERSDPAPEGEESTEKDDAG